MKAIYMLVSLCLVITACGPSAQELTATAVVAQAQTQTAAPTETPTLTPTPRPTITPTATFTSSPTPTVHLITKLEPEDVETFSGSMETMLFTLPKENFNNTLEDIKNINSNSKCPALRIASVPGKPNPFYGLIIKVSPDNIETVFIYAIRPTIPEMEPYSFVGMVTIPPGTDEKFFVPVEYQTPKGEANPKELEISVVFPGCEIYTEIVLWQ